MPDLTLDGRPLHVADGTSVAAALALGGDGCARTSVSGERRAPLCGMGDIMSRAGELDLSADYYERALYNHILSSQRPEGGFVYFTPMRPKVSAQDGSPYGVRTTWRWVTSRMGNLARLLPPMMASMTFSLFWLLSPDSNLPA